MARVYFGSTAKGTIYRAAAGAAQAEPWILASTAGLTNVLGVLADDKSQHAVGLPEQHRRPRWRARRRTDRASIFRLEQRCAHSSCAPAG